MRLSRSSLEFGLVRWTDVTRPTDEGRFLTVSTDIVQNGGGSAFRLRVRERQAFQRYGPERFKLPCHDG